MIRLVVLSLLFSMSLNAFAQCAYDYEGIYGRKRCHQPHTDSNYVQLVQVEAINNNRIKITNFILNEIWVTCYVEDSIFVNLDCQNMTLECENIIYDLCAVAGYMGFNGEGQLYTDSIRIQYTVANPDGSVGNSCITYTKDAYVGIGRPIVQLNEVIYPNPSNGTFHFKNELENGISVQVINPHGTIVDKVKTNNNSIELSHLPSGLYYIKYQYRTESISMARIIIF